MMRHQLGISVLLIAAFGTPETMAEMITDTINFTLEGGGPLPTDGMFTYDTVAHSFSSFTVTWDGFLFDLSVRANDPIHSVPYPSCLGGATLALATFDLLTGSCGPPPPAGFETAWQAGVAVDPFTGVGVAGFDFITTPSIFEFNGPLFEVVAGQSTPLPPESSFGAGGGWTLSPTSAPVPEPSLLMPATLFLCAFVARKRVAQERRQR